MNVKPGFHLILDGAPASPFRGAAPSPEAHAHRMTEREREEVRVLRLLRLARDRGDRLAIATLETSARLLVPRLFWSMWGLLRDDEAVEVRTTLGRIRL